MSTENEETVVEIDEPTGLKMGEFTPVKIDKPKNVTEVNPKENQVEFDFEGEEEPKPKVEAKVEAKVEEEAEDDLDIEIVDDTPPEDQNRTPSTPPEDVTEDELEDYTKKAAKRLKHFSKGYHDERRAKETAQRERAELESFARKMVEENKGLKAQTSKSQTAMVEQARITVASQVTDAKREYQEAYDSGSAVALADAQEKLTKASIRADKIANIKLAPLQEAETNVQTQDRSSTPTEVYVEDKDAEDWKGRNSWYDKQGNEDMTAFALGYHHKLLKEGVDPRTKTYYEKLDARMQEVFPKELGVASPETSTDGETSKTGKQKSTNVVAPATRSTGPKKVTLSRTQVAIANKLGVPLKLYAAQVAAEERKQK